MKRIFIFLGFVLILITNMAFADVLIISNKNVSESTLSPKKVKEIFLGKRVQWEDKTKIHFATLTDSDLHAEFVKTYLRKSTKQFKAYWKNMIFTGKGKKPKSFNSTKEVLEYVANTKGAIGYIDTNTTPVNVNTIKIQ